MGDIGEETHVHLIGAQFLLFLHLCLAGGTAGMDHAAGIAVEVVGQGGGEGRVDEPCPPRVGGGGLDDDAQGALLGVGLVAGAVGGLHAEGIGARGQVGVAGGMGVAGIDPVVVEAVHLIIIMYAFVLAEVEGGEREAEAVLVVGEAHLATAVEQGVDGSVGGRAHELVVDLQVAQADGYLTQGVDIGGVEHRDAVGAAEDEAAVGQLTGGAVSELVAADAVGLIERGDAPRLTVPAVQTLHRRDPEVALAVLLDAAHIGTGETGDARHLVGLGVIAQQAVADGAYPHVALGVLEHVGGDIDAAADARGHRGDIEFGELARLRVQAGDLLEEGGDEHLAVVELEQGGDEAEVGIEGLLHEGLVAAGGEAEDVVGAGGCPHGAVVGLAEVHRGERGPLSEDGEAAAVVAAFQDDAGCG